MKKEEILLLKNELSKDTGLDISPEKIVEQLKLFEEGVPFLKLVKACKINDGIKHIPEEDKSQLMEYFKEALNDQRVIKFVPASGAATRMFKKLHAVLSYGERVTIEELERRNADENAVAAVKFLNNITRFAFYKDLKECLKKNGKDILRMIELGDITDILIFVLDERGLNYANLPKGCIKFHDYPDGARTAFEEHIVEAVNYAADKNKRADIHFTISPEHENSIKHLLEELKTKYKKEGWYLNIGLSFQNPSTNTVAATPDNKPFRDENGRLIFRPAGHGALLKNLNELNGDIIMIKNIDNVVQDHLKEDTYKFKRILGGYLVEIQNKIFAFLNELEKNFDEKLIDRIEAFGRSELELELRSDFISLSIAEKKKYLFELLNRPLRVCGMVRREGHAGGGPFWVEDGQGNISRQVVENTQIDLNDSEQKKIFEDATHFSPVDFVCGIKDYKGNNFNLDKYSNPKTGLITQKSKDGKELKALELPGLWNGGMYYWLTVFVEVPLITFNPVKEINDLLEPEHQPELN